MISLRKLLGANVILLGLISFLADVSSEMALPALPLFISSLGGGGFVLGLAGGLGDGASSLLRLASGYTSDRTGKFKPLIALGYLTSALSKLGLSLALWWPQAVAFRILDRVGKGVRTPPRDALIAISTTPGWEGRAFGLHRAMDTAGALVGSIVALILLGFLYVEFKTFFLIAALVAFSALVPIYFIKEAPYPKASEGFLPSISKAPRKFKFLLLATTLFSMGNLSIMLLIFRASMLFKDWGLHDGSSNAIHPLQPSLCCIRLHSGSLGR